MGEAFLDYKKGGSGLNINGIIQDYYVYAGEKVSAGDFVEFVNGVAGKSNVGTSVDTQIVQQRTNSGGDFSAVVLDDKRVFVTHENPDSYSHLYGVVVTIEGAKITVGTSTQLYNTTGSGNNVSTVVLADGRVLVLFGVYSKYPLYGLVCTISGTTVSVSIAAKSICGNNYSSYFSSPALLNNGNVFVAFNTDSSYGLSGVVVSVSATAITVGTILQLNSSNYTGYGGISTNVLNDSQIFIFHNGNSGFYATSCSVYNTTITLGSTTQLSSKGSANVLSTTKLKNGDIFIARAYDTTNYYLYGKVVTVSGTQITYLGVDTQLSAEVNSARGLSVITLENGKVFIAHSCTSPSNYLHGMLATVDNKVITTGNDIRLSTRSYSGNAISSKLLQSGNVFVVHSYDSYPAIYGQVFSVDETNDIPTNQITITEYETQVRPATSLPCKGVAKSSGEGGDDTGHKDIVSVYTVEKTLAMLPVGTLVKDPNSTFLGEPVIWKIADVNHEGYPSNSVTLISDKILALRCFDAKEPNNSNITRQGNGNGRYSVSNIRQWLNSDAEAGQWYSAQHDADTPPNSSYVWANNDDSEATNPYDIDAGFLNGFSQNFKNVLLETNLTVALNTVTDGGGSEIVTDKIFLASNTEVGLANENSISEGALLPLFSDNTSRIASVTATGLEDSNYSNDPAENEAWYWWLRTPLALGVHSVRRVNATGAIGDAPAYSGAWGIRPLCNLPSSIRVTQDEDGIYKLAF